MRSRKICADRKEVVKGHHADRITSEQMQEVETAEKVSVVKKCVRDSRDSRERKPRN